MLNERDGVAVAGGYNTDSFTPGSQDAYLNSKAHLHAQNNEQFRDQQAWKALLQFKR